MSFASPWFLLLALTLPALAWLGWPARGSTQGRERVSLLLRLLIAALLILSLAGLELRRASDTLSVVFLVDDSDSMRLPLQTEAGATTPHQLALAYVRRALETMPVEDAAGVVLFGGDAVVERPLSASRALALPTSKVVSLQTDLAGAIRLGLALLPTDTARRLVILSDGLETTGDALEAARLAAANGTQIVVVPFNISGGSEALVTAVKAPTRLRQGEEFALDVQIESTLDQVVGVRVLAGEAVAYEGQLQLRRGPNAFALPLKAGAPGFAAYRVQITPAAGADTFYQNNEVAAFTQVAGPPRLLLITNPQPRDGVAGEPELLAALRASGFQVDVLDPARLPAELPALSEYASVILVDVPARALAQRQMRALETYVRDLGGGLVAVGGPTSYGVGGYFRTPLAEVLPVDMEIKDQKRRARLTLVFIVDKSGSMSEVSGGAQKVDLAKEAVIRSLELLSPTDKVGVIAFDDTAAWVVPITPLENPDAVANAVGTIRADGGTDILAGVQLAAGALPQDDSAVKHVILLTDGGADPTGIPELVRRLNEEYGVTLSTVGVGPGAAPFLPQLAEAGGGLHHFAADPSTIPAIFAEETTLATRAYIVEQDFFPAQVSPSPILAGLTAVPRLLGYIGTTAKSAAQTILVNPDSPNPEAPDPVLAAWQFGLGKSVAWTSDATGRWAKYWVSWDEYARFWAQAVRYTISAGAASPAGVRVERSGEQAALTVDAQTPAGAFLNGLTVQANVVGPDGETQTVTLAQVAPGRYTGAFTPAAEGAYLIRVTGVEGAADGEPAVAQTAGWVLSYSPEYQRLAAPPETDSQAMPAQVRFLLQVAALTGGGAVTGDYARVFAHDLPQPPSSAQPVWPALLLAAALLWPVDIAVRRLVITRLDLRRAWERGVSWLGLGARPVVAAPPRPERLSGLFQAKQRAGEAAPRSPAGERPAAGPPPAAASQVDSPPPPMSPPATPPAASPTTTSAALLAKKKAREKKPGD
ncbi:MAG: VWA domain-containing protein [Anaerolineales bacterium]|nr:VWA domain-containing protein [Anaerolineales bacterium]